MRDRRLLLLSASTIHGHGYLDHAETAILELLQGVDEVTFVPYALFDRDAYAAKVRARLGALGKRLVSVHESKAPDLVIARAKSIFVGGGNTFRLLKALQETGLVEAIRERVASGAAYLGSSAGSIVAGPTIRTTKDMPIVEPRSFDALGLVPFQVSPHYLDPDPSSTHMGETQEERINQFLEENDAPVAGMREGAMLRVGLGSVVLQGSAGLRVFRRSRPPVEALPIARVDDLLVASGPSLQAPPSAGRNPAASPTAS